MEPKEMLKRKRLVLIVSLLLTFCFIISKRRISQTGGMVNASIPLSGRTIVVDPGHGGVDGGTSHKDGTLEKDINLEISLELKRALEKAGANVIMTRTTDTALDHLNKKDQYRHKRDLIARTDIINNASPQVFLCIHVNAEPRSAKVSGPMIFYYRWDEEGKSLAQLLQKHMEEAYVNAGQKVNPRDPISNTNLYILKNANVPGVLVETGFITNPGDLGLLKTRKFQEELAKAMVQGLKDFF